MAELNREDIITDGALAVPKELAKNLDEPIAKVDILIARFKELNSTLGSENSLSKVRKSTIELTDSQKELIKIQEQITKTQAKNNDVYIEQQRILQQTKQEMKEKIALGNRDAQTVTALNASYRVLEAALNKNRAAYALLATEEERSSEAGQRLLRIINQQDKEFKELSNRIGKTNVNVGDYAGGILKAYNEVQKLKGANAGLAKQLPQINKETAEGAARYNQLNQAIQNNITQINTYNKVINTTGTKVQNLANQFLGALGLVGAIYLVINAIKSFINTNREFEKSLSTLQALTGATAQDLMFYKQAAIDIGAETKRSAKDVVEAFKLIGGARPELLKSKDALAAVTREAIILANASEMELADAADALAGALNQLEAPAEDAGRFINVLAAAAQAGAAEIPDVNAALKEFGAVLKDSNGSIEEGAALIEVLAERQIKGAEAGTALRNVLLRLAAVDVLPKSAQAQMKRFGVDLKVVGDASLPLNKRLRELGKIAGDASALVKVFGVENFVAGNIVLNNVDKFEELTTAVTGTTSAYDQNQIALDNLDGDIRSAGAEIEAFTLEIGKSTDKLLRFIVQGFTVFIKTLRELPAFLKENKDLFIALGIAILGLNAPMIATNLLVLKSIALRRLEAITLASVTAATRAYFATLLANPFGLVLVALAALLAAVSIYDRNSKRANDVTKQTKALNNELEFALMKVRIERDKLNLSIDDFIKLSPKEQQQLLDTIKLRKQESLALLQMILAREESVKSAAKQVTTMTALSKVFTDLFDSQDEAQSRLDKTLQEQADAAVAPFQERIAQLKLEIDELDNFLKDTGKAQKDQAIANTKAEKDALFNLRKFRIEQAIKAQEEIEQLESNALADRIAANTAGAKLEEMLAQLERDNALKKDKITASERTLIEEQYQAKLLEIRTRARKDSEKLNEGEADEQRKIAEAKLRANIQLNENILNNDLSTLEQRNNASLEAADARQQLLDIQYQRDIAKAEGNAEELIRLQIDYNSESEKLAKDLAESIKKNYFDVLTKEYNNTIVRAQNAANAQIKALDEQFTNGTIKIGEYQRKREQLVKEGNTAVLKEELKAAKDAIRILEREGIDTTDVRQKIADLEVAIAEDSANKRLAIEEKIAEKKKELQQAVFDSAIALSANLTTREIQRLDGQIEALEENYERQVNLAGDNERRKQELAVEFDRKKQKLEDEKNARLRKQAILEKALNIAKATINTALAVTAALVEGGPVYAALVGALGALEIAAIVSTPIPAFKDGGITPGGTILAGEAGAELMVSPTGKLGFTPSTATLMDVEKDTRIFSHPDTMRILALMSMNSGGTLGTREDALLSVVGDKLDGIKQEIHGLANRPQSSIVNDGHNIWEAQRRGTSYSKKIRKLTHGS